MTPDQQTALERPDPKYVYFAEFHFASGIARLSTLNVNVDWGGYSWMGIGAIGSIDPIDESQGTAAKYLTFSLSLPQTEWLALALGPVEEFRGRDAKLYFCPIDDNYRMIDTPEQCWRGIMDQMPSGISGGRDNPVGTINLRCETSAYGLKRQSGLRLTAVQHKVTYPNDTALDKLVDLCAKQYPWASIRYQRQ